MRSLRLLTVLLVVLVLVPAGILAWLGYRSAAALDAEAAGRIRRELDDAQKLLTEQGKAAAAEIDTLLAGVVAEGADTVQRRLPFEPAAVVLPEVELAMRAVLPATFVDDGLPFTEGGPSTRSVHGLLGLTLRDAAGRSLYPAAWHPEDGMPATVAWASLLDALRREADRRLYGGGEDATDRARAVWEEARERLSHDVMRATVDVELALLDVRAGRATAAAVSEDLDDLYAPALLRQVGRPLLRLWLLAAAEAPAPRERLMAADADGTLAAVPLTDRERRLALRYAAEARRRRGESVPPDDPRGWPSYERSPSFVVEAPLPGGAVLEARFSESWALSRFNSKTLGDAFEGSLRAGVGPPRPVWSRTSQGGYEFIRSWHGPAWGDHRALYSLTHWDAPRLGAEAAARRTWTGVGIGALLLLVVVGLLLVGRAVGRERAARRLRDDFIANVSHELRTPLTSVCLHAELLAEEAGDAAPDRRVALAQVVRAEGDRLAALVDDLLDFAALERGARTIEPEPVDLAAAVRAAAAPYAVLAAREGVRLELEIPAEEVPVLADAHGLARILANLLSNAWRHGRPSRDGGAGRMRVVVDAEACHAEVRDDGRGIPVAERMLVFERFRRGRGAERVEGTGLGLALSRELARAMGGDLRIVEDARETVLRVTLPPVPEEETP